jgi:hypothetical protein
MVRLVRPGLRRAELIAFGVLHDPISFLIWEPKHLELRGKSMIPMPVLLAAVSHTATMDSMPRILAGPMAWARLG